LAYIILRCFANFLDDPYYEPLFMVNDISGVVKGRPGRAQALPTTCCALPL